MTDTPHPGRRTFGPVVLLGLLAGVATALAGTRAWATVAGYSDAGEASAYASSLSLAAEQGEAPAVNALALVGLACWGVLLVTRGRVRRSVAWLGLGSALGTLAAVVVAYDATARDVRSAFEDLGMTAEVDVSRSGWIWVGVAGAVLGMVAWGAAVRFVRHWPEMGTRYDRTPAEPSEGDLWKALDQGHDPTS